jgi:hypothetical protein
MNMDCHMGTQFCLNLKIFDRRLDFLNVKPTMTRISATPEQFSQSQHNLRIKMKVTDGSFSIVARSIGQFTRISRLDTVHMGRF